MRIVKMNGYNFTLLLFPSSERLYWNLGRCYQDLASIRVIWKSQIRTKLIGKKLNSVYIALCLQPD